MKKIQNRKYILGAVLVGSLLACSASQAGLHIDFSEVSSDVVVTFSGSYDLWEHAANNSQSSSRLYHSASGEIDLSSRNNPNDWSPTYEYTSATNPTGNPFTGAFAYAYPDLITGDTAGFTSFANYGVRFYANDGYVAGDAISGTLTYNNTNLSDLMLPSSGAGTIDFVSIGGGPENVTWGIDGAAVPEPATAGLLGISGLILFGLRRLKKNYGFK